jgi:hypothetical protein
MQQHPQQLELARLLVAKGARTADGATPVQVAVAAGWVPLLQACVGEHCKAGSMDHQVTLHRSCSSRFSKGPSTYCMQHDDDCNTAHQHAVAAESHAFSLHKAIKCT